jgi:hypothetical protein
VQHLNEYIREKRLTGTKTGGDQLNAIKGKLRR